MSSSNFPLPHRHSFPPPISYPPLLVSHIVSASWSEQLWLSQQSFPLSFHNEGHHHNYIWVQRGEEKSLSKLKKCKANWKEMKGSLRLVDKWNHVGSSRKLKKTWNCLLYELFSFLGVHGRLCDMGYKTQSSVVSILSNTKLFHGLYVM